MSDEPQLRKAKFRCPHCEAITGWHWYGPFDTANMPPDIASATCMSCSGWTVWLRDVMYFPPVARAGALPNEDLPKEIRADLQEARTIVNLSPRAAAALVRLALQKLCKELGEPGKNINDDIGQLVAKKGLSPTIQRALDVVRVVGNNAVHPGEIDLKDDRDTALKLFDFINLIADRLISEPKRVQALYDGLPQRALDGIERRDGGET